MSAVYHAENGVWRVLGTGTGVPPTGPLLYNPDTVVPLDNPSDINIPTSGGNLGSLGTTTDYRFNWPAAPVTNGISWTGGRNIQSIGGYMNLTTVSTAQKYAFLGRSVRGDVYQEGLYVDASTGLDWDITVVDGVATSGVSRSTWTRPKLYQQNCLFKGSEWTSPDAVHPDIVQRQGPMGGLYVYQVTYETEYQGYFVPHFEQSSGGVENWIDGMPMAFERVNGKTREERAGYLMWLGMIGKQNALFPGPEDPAPISLTDVWVNGLAGDTLGANLVFPKVGSVGNQNESIGMVLSADGLTATWPPFTQITGSVKKGIPPGGDFVPTGSTSVTPATSNPGLGYTTPGYQN